MRMHIFCYFSAHGKKIGTPIKSPVFLFPPFGHLILIINNENACLKLYKIKEFHAKRSSKKIFLRAQERGKITYCGMQGKLGYGCC